jgi:hypothetical protein
VLATRGWGRDEFRYASPAFLATVRRALYAESGARILDVVTDGLEKANERLGQAPRGSAARGDLMRVRVAALDSMNTVRKALDLDG